MKLIALHSGEWRPAAGAATEDEWDLSPERQLLAAEEPPALDVEDMVADLPARQAAAVLLVFRDGRSVSDAARELGVTKAAVMKLKRKALAKLRAKQAAQRSNHEGSNA